MRSSETLHPLTAYDAHDLTRKTDSGQMQPEGAWVADWYKKEDPSPTDMLYMIAWLLHQLNVARTEHGRATAEAVKTERERCNGLVRDYFLAQEAGPDVTQLHVAIVDGEEEVDFAASTTPKEDE